MLVDWTNHLDETITNHDSEVLEFEQVILKYLTAQSLINVDIASAQIKHRNLAAASEIANALLANDVRERGSDVELLYGASADVEQTRHRSLANNVNYDLSAEIEQSRERHLNAVAEIVYMITAEQMRERVLTAAATITVRLVSAIKKFYGYWATIMVKIKE